MSARSLVLWLGDHTGHVLDQPGSDVVGTVSMRLADAGRNSTALRRARLQLGLGVALDTEAWRNQCRADHLLRGPRFRDLGYDSRDLFGIARLDIGRRMSTEHGAAYAEAHLQAQLARDPTIIGCPGHVHASAIGRENDLALARETLKLVDRRALREPRDGDRHERRRVVFATLCVRTADLSHELIREIVAAYIDLKVDGYWVWAMDFQPSGLRAEMMLRLVLALQENSGRPACPGGLGHLWQASLARGAAGAIAGQHRSTVRFDPDQPPPEPRDPDEDDENPRLIATYHGALLGCFALGERGAEVARQTFARNACGCGHHPAGAPPRGQRQILAHNQWWRLLEARRACASSASFASEHLERRLPGVRAERAAVGLKKGLDVGWQRSVEDWDQLPVGWGAAAGSDA